MKPLKKGDRVRIRQGQRQFEGIVVIVDDDKATVEVQHGDETQTYVRRTTLVERL